MGIFTEYIERDKTRRKIQELRVYGIPTTKEVKPSGVFFKMIIKDSGDAFLQIEERLLLVRHELEQIYNSNEINNIVAHSALYACQTMANFFEASINNIDDIITHPENYKVNYSKIKYERKPAMRPQFKASSNHIPEEFEPFKKLVTRSIGRNFALLKKYANFYDSKEKEEVKDLEKRLKNINAKFNSDDKYIWNLYYAQYIPAVLEKDTDLITNNQ